MATSLYDQYLAAQPDTSGPSLYDQHLASQPDTSGPSLYDQHLATQGDTVAANILKDNPGAAEIARTQQPAPTTIDYSKPIPVDRASGQSREALSDADTKARLGQIIPSLSGLVHGVVDPFVTLAKEGAYQLAPNSALREKYFPRPTGAQVLAAAPQAAISAVAPGAYEEMNAIKSPLVRVGAKLAAGSGIGAVFNPGDMKKGAVLGAALGGAGGVAEDLGGLQKSLAGMIDPETAAQAVQVPQLAAERDIANARAAAGPRSLDEVAARVIPQRGPPALGPAPTRAFADFHGLSAEDQAHFGSFENYTPEGLAQLYKDRLAARRAGVQIPTNEADAVSGTPPARITEPHPQVDGPSNGPLPAGGLATPETAQPAPVGTIDPVAQPALHDQVKRSGVYAHDQYGRSPWDDGYGTDQPPVDTPREQPRQLATRDANGKLVRNLKNVPIDDLHQEYSNIADAVASNTAVAPWARQTEYGTTVTGTSRANWAANSQFKAMERIRAEVQRRGGDVEYRNAGVSLPQKAGDAVKNALDRPYAQLENPADLPVRNQLLAAGAGRGHGMYVAKRGGAYITNGLDPEQVAQIGAKLTADNIQAVADSRRAAGDQAAADIAQQHADQIMQGVPAGIEKTPAYQTYVDRYREVYEPHYNETSTKTGVSEDNFRAVAPNSVYVPLAADQLAQAPVRTLRNRLNVKGTGLSSAAKMATGTGSYSLDPTVAAERFMPERTAKAAQNDLWQAVRSRGRELASQYTPLLDGERLVVFDDKNQLTTPEAENARHYVAIPEHVNDALQQFIDRKNAPKGEGKINHALTSAAMIGSPAVGITHGGSIAQTVNSMSTGGLGDIPRTAAAALPFGNTLAGIADINRIDMNDPATVQRQFAVSKYGGLRPIDMEKPLSDNPILRAGQKLGRWAHNDLFGLGGIDERGRAVAAQRLMDQNPDAHPADIAQQLGQAFGQYNQLNQPGFVYEGQKRGITSFAPAGIGFTSEAVKRMTGQRGVLPFVKSTAAPIAGLVAANYALSGHSPMQNDAGHRGDIDLGYTGGPNDTEQYLRSSYAYPLLNRAVNTVGARPLLEGDGLSGAAGGAANEALAQVGVIPRSIFGLANASLREARGYNGLDQAVKPQFGESNRFLKIVQGAGAPFLGAAGGVGGFNTYDANQSFTDRVLNAGHANAVASGRAGGSSDDDVRYAGLQDKITAAKAEVYKVQGDTAKTSAVIGNILARARSDGYSQDALDLIESQLQKAAEKSAADRAELRQSAMQKKGLGAP